MQGELVEIVAAGDRSSVVVHLAGAPQAFGPDPVHDAVNAGAVPAVSVHDCSLQLTAMIRYRWTPRGREAA
jgi:hypothetical protein